MRSFGRGQERRLGQPRDHGPAQLGVQLPGGDGPRDQRQRPTLRTQLRGPRQLPDELRVRLRGRVHQEVPRRPRRDPPPRRVEREGRQQQRGQVQRVVRRRRGVDDRGRAGGQRRRRPVSHRDGPGDRPARTVPFLDRTVGEQRVRPAAPSGRRRASGSAAASSAIRTDGPSRRATSSRTTPSTTISTRSRPGRASSSASSTPASRRATSATAAPSRSGSTTAVSNPSGGAPPHGNGSRSTDACP